MTGRRGEHGNAVVFILIAITLFGALAYTFTNSAKQGQGNINAGQAKITANSIFYDMQIFERAVDKLRSRGCSENQISFENTTNTNYVNTNAPSDKHCHLFDPAGANLPWKTVSIGGVNKEYLFTGFNDVGTGVQGDLLAIILDVPLSLCQAINKEIKYVSYPDIPREAGLPITPQRYFIGTYVNYAFNCNDSPVNPSTNFCAGSGGRQIPLMCVETGTLGKYAIYGIIFNR